MKSSGSQSLGDIAEKWTFIPHFQQLGFCVSGTNFSLRQHISLLIQMKQNRAHKQACQDGYKHKGKTKPVSEPVMGSLPGEEDIGA